MVAGKNPEPAGIIRNRFVKSKFSREVCPRPLDCCARSGFSIRVLPRKIISEYVVNLIQLPKKGFVLCEFFQAPLPRELQHADRIVVRTVPQIGIEMAEKAAGRRFPRPPEIKAHFPKRLECRRKGGDHIINLKRRHWRQRNGTLSKKS